MIIKLAIDTTKKESFKDVKRGATIGSGLLFGKNLVRFDKEINPQVGRVRRFLLNKQLIKPRLKDVVTKSHLTWGRAAKMGILGAIGGGLIGLGIHEGKKRIKKFR